VSGGHTKIVLMQSSPSPFFDKTGKNLEQNPSVDKSTSPLKKGRSLNFDRID
jgi:hypothetical protein